MAPPLQQSQPAGALGDVRILDFSRVLAGPLATMLLADFGAEVLKVEKPGTGDDTRQWGPPFDERGDATYFQSVNRNKQSVVIDLQTAAGVSQARELARGADVVVENFRPGLMDDLGLGYAELSAENPALIFCSLTGFGAGAPELPGYDLLVQALGGLMSITGAADGEPQKVGVALVDVLAGLFATVGILTALRERDRSGAGQRVEIDLLSSLLAALVNQASGFTAAGVVPQRMGNRHPSITPYESLRCADSEIVIAVGNDRQFSSLARLLGDPTLATDARFATNPARVKHREELVVALEARLSTRSAADWSEELTAARVPAGVVNDLAGAFALAARLGLEPTVNLPRADGTTVALARNPVRLSRTPASYHSAPPELDEHRGADWTGAPIHLGD
jgi:crotonobetainyl-CoA:carnitine CoA-transferase CaiB-like acyl-CoA transferase